MVEKELKPRMGQEGQRKSEWMSTVLSYYSFLDFTRLQPRKIGKL